MTAVRGVIAALIITSLAIAAFLLLTRSDAHQPLAASPTTVVADTTSSVVSNTAAASTTTAAPATTTLEQREQEVAEILQALWFGWFDAIYRKDTDALDYVVATDGFRESGRAAMEVLTYERAPAIDAVEVDLHEILLDRADCLVTHATVDVQAFRGPGAIIKRVDVMWPVETGWARATAWGSPADLWLADCDLLARETAP